MRRHPYRGIYSQIAREEGVNRTTVKAAIEKYRNPRLCQRFFEIANERRAQVERYEKLTGGGKS